LLSQAEHVRQKELLTALNMIGPVDEREKKILDDLTNILLKQTFVPIIENLRTAAKNGDMKTVEIAVKLFEKTGKN
jgi:glutamyl-tRNA reductase